MPAFAFPESVRPVVGSICRNGQVLVISAQCTVHRYTGTPHHVLSCESQHTPQWVGHHPTQKNPPQKKKINSQLFTTFHNFSQFFTIFHQPSQFYSGFRVVKTCENLSHFVKICEMHTPREAPQGKKKLDSEDCTTVATQPRQLRYSNNLSNNTVPHMVQIAFIGSGRRE